MAKTTVRFKGFRGNEFECSVSTPMGQNLTVKGHLDDLVPTVDGSELLASNPALVNNLWSYGKQEKLSRLTRSPVKRKAHSKAAHGHLEVAETLANDLELLTEITREGWCSECLTFSEHTKADVPRIDTDVYLCGACGSRTSICPAPGCKNMASRGPKRIRLRRYCAEHRHDIPSFEKASATIRDLSEYKELLTFEKKNLGAATRVSSVAVAITGGAALTIATVGGALPTAVGGAIGTFKGLSGAAAIKSGLATLGGGSLAAGGLGMAGGTAVVTAGGSLLTGGLGMSVMSAYLADDKSFRIEKIRDGAGIPVIVANGFLTEGKSKAHQWEDTLTSRYPDSPIYEVHWGSKDLRRLTTLVAPRQALMMAGKQGGKSLAMKATKAGAAAASRSVSAVTGVASLIKNPWHTARSRADKTGVLLAGIIARTEEGPYVLAGHSLGARVMAVAAETLATSSDTPHVREMHLLGAAMSSKQDWRMLSNAVEDTIYNYFSTNDQVLKYLYSAAQAGSIPVGSKGFQSAFSNIKDVNVSRSVKGHSDYWKVVKLK